MKTTLSTIQEHKPCKEGWDKLLSFLGKTEADEEELSILTILDSNGLDHTLWCFRVIKGHDDTLRQFAKWCALQNIEKVKSYYSEESYDAIIDYLTSDSNNRLTTRSIIQEATVPLSTSLALRSILWSTSESAQTSAWLTSWFSRLSESSARSIKLAQEAKLKELLNSI